MEAIARENNKWCAPGRAGILACAISYLKKVAVSKSREIARVAYLGHNEYWKWLHAKTIKGALLGGSGY